jgi:multicomponent Na+:H+ antiporter subunit B
LRIKTLTSLLFVSGLAILLVAALARLPFGGAPMQVGQAINGAAPAEVGTANQVTAVLLAYRGLDTLGELSILFIAATAVGLILGRQAGRPDHPAGFVLRTGGELLFPFLIVLGSYIIIHGHLTPGGGFQGGVILAAAFFIPHLARPGSPYPETAMTIIEGLAGAVFVILGLAALAETGEFLAPLFGTGTFAKLVSAGSLPLLSLAIGLKVGVELGGLVGRIGDLETPEGHDG